MDQVKIGKFIAECRKNANLTQTQQARRIQKGIEEINSNMQNTTQSGGVLFRMKE